MKSAYIHVTTSKLDQFVTMSESQATAHRTLLTYFIHFLLFMVMGSGANFSLPTALLEEIPYFEENQPEGVCIATYMNVVTSFGIFSVFAYVYYHSCIKKIPFTVSVPTILIVSCCGAFFAALVYRITVGGISLMLYFACLIGGSVGALSMVCSIGYLVFRVKIPICFICCCR